jgi:Cu+-exporting ATPase
MFVGDGVNDSPVLAQADIGVAVSAASDVTVNAAQIVCMKDRLDDVLNAILISKATLLRIKINFGWAFVYNLILVPIAMGVFQPLGLQLDPMWAGFAMAMSSVSVVLSSLFLRCYKYTNL